MKFLSNFPEGYTPTSSQVYILKSLENTFKKKKFAIIRAPTGSGKSFISKALGNASDECSEGFKQLVESYDAFKTDQFGDYQHEMDCMAEPAHGTFALTITKQLQDQYVELFENTQHLKGKTNYKCNIDENFDVEAAPCIFSTTLRNTCWANNKCTYYTQRNESIISKFSVLNYSMFLALPGHVKRRNYIVCDEASELEEELANRYGVTIEYAKLKLAGIEAVKVTTDAYDRVYTWINNLHIDINEECQDLKERMSNKITGISLGERIKLKYLSNLSMKIATVLDYWTRCEYVIDKNAERISFTPLNVDVLSKDIFDYSDKIVLMSATITRPEMYAKSLGLTSKDYDFIDVDSTFDAKKSPIYISSKTPLNYENLKKNLPVIAQQIQELCDAHGTEKGLIHTHTSEICNYLKMKLKGRRFIFREEHLNNEKLIEMHFASKEPTILVSPSLGFGTDFKGDKGRFQIIVKTPYPPLSNKRIRRKFDIDKTWYTDKTINTLVQMTGRCTRSKDDHSVTYVLDSTAIKLIKENVSNLPKHFVERIV
jgi:ATP-dependent DNA helicase DinG